MSNAYTEAEITEALMALVATASNASAAERWLKSQGKRTPVSKTLTEWSRTTYLERFNELREKYRDKLEADLAHSMRDAARAATAATLEAVEAARQGIRNKTEKDPARAAANLARVAQSQTDKLLSLTGRPTQITETRNLEQIMRSLVAKGVLTLPEEPERVQIEEAHVDEPVP